MDSENRITPEYSAQKIRTSFNSAIPWPPCYFGRFSLTGVCGIAVLALPFAPLPVEASCFRHEDSDWTHPRLSLFAKNSGKRRIL
jgi:hypothetical protein